MVQIALWSFGRRGEGANIAPAPAKARVAVVNLKAIVRAEQYVSQDLTQIQRLESRFARQAQMLQHLEPT